MKLMTTRRILRLLGALLPALLLIAEAVHGQLVVRVENVYIREDQIPEGWTLISSQRNSEVFTRIIEAQLDCYLTSVWTQKFEAQGDLIEIEYIGGVTEDETAKAYSEMSSQKKADIVCHKGRFVIAIRSRNPELIRTAMRTLRPEPLDRIKLLNLDLPAGQRVKAEVLANLIQREALAKHLEIDPLSVLNQFFEGPKLQLRQITYVACDTVEDASKAAIRAREMSKGRNPILHEGMFVIEIAGEDRWAERVRPEVEANLGIVAAAELELLEAVRNHLFSPTPTNTPTKLRHLR